MTHDDQLLTIRDVAKQAQVTPQAVYKWIKEGRLHTVVVGSRMRVPLSQWMAFVNQGKRQASA